MLITVTVGVLMAFVGYVFGRDKGRKQGMMKMGIVIATAIKSDPAGVLKTFDRLESEVTIKLFGNDSQMMPKITKTEILR